jgi:hypothetical protein
VGSHAARDGPRRACRTLRGVESRHRGAAHVRLPGCGTFRLRPAGQLRRAADRAVDEAVPGRGRRADPGDGPAHRMVAAATTGSTT